MRHEEIDIAIKERWLKTEFRSRKPEAQIEAVLRLLLFIAARARVPEAVRP